MSTILIVDDEPTICWALQRALAEEGHEVTTSATAEDALAQVNNAVPDVIMMDVRLPGMDGLSALEQLRMQVPNTPVVIITAFGNLDTAVQAIHRGAFEYLTKPFDLDQAIAVIRRALHGRTPDEPDVDVLSTGSDLDQKLLGSSPQMQRIYRDIAIVADRDVPVLITGESGTGKELVAAAIHQYSERASGPFVPVCIPAMSESVLESELFGHAKGAFTGAVESREGLINAAHRGTAFFDEIGEVSIATQVKLLRVLESKAVTPVGGNEPRQSDFRLLAATNRNLEAMVKAGTFREDLYYRLNVYQIEIPPLRARPDDIPVLARHFMTLLDPQGNVSLSEAALDELRSRRWNGNVRELRNAIEHAVIVTRSGTISADSFPAPMISAAEPLEAGESFASVVRNWFRSRTDSRASVSDIVNLNEEFLAEAEPVMLVEALRLSNENRQEAARILGMHRQTLREKLRKYDLDSAGKN